MVFHAAEQEGGDRARAGAGRGGQRGREHVGASFGGRLPVRLPGGSGTNRLLPDRARGRPSGWSCSDWRARMRCCSEASAKTAAWRSKRRSPTTRRRANLNVELDIGRTGPDAADGSRAAARSGGGDVSGAQRRLPGFWPGTKRTAARQPAHPSTAAARQGSDVVRCMRMPPTSARARRAVAAGICRRAAAPSAAAGLPARVEIWGHTNFDDRGRPVSDRTA